MEGAAGGGFDADLARDDGRGALRTIFEDLEEIAALSGRERRQAPSRRAAGMWSRVLRFRPQMTAQSPDPGSGRKFDQYALEYERLHAASIESSGESTEYFADYKVQCLERIGAPSSGPILDFGCGVGNLTTKLVGRFLEVHGFDPSKESLELARTRAPGALFHDSLAAIADGSCETAVLSGVLHHVPPADRQTVLAQAKSKLTAGGRIVVFEHNPINPLTRRAVATCEFDDDAILLWPWEARRVLRSAGFTNVELDYIVFFPRGLASMRQLEPRLNWLMLGAQVMVVGTNS